MTAGSPAIVVRLCARGSRVPEAAERSWRERGAGPGALTVSLASCASRSPGPTSTRAAGGDRAGGGRRIAAILLAGVAGFFVGSAAWLGLPLAWVVLVRMVFGGFLRRRASMLYVQLPDALAMIVRSVRAGIPVPEALRIVGEEGQWPTSAEFVRLYDEIRLGGSLPDALVKLARRSTLLEYRFFAVALALQSQSGGSLTETLENLADVVRKRVALKQRAIALSSEARMTMWVLAALPFVHRRCPRGAQPGIHPRAGHHAGRAEAPPRCRLALLCLGIGSMNVIIKKSVS